MSASVTEQKRTVAEVVVRCEECDLFIYRTNVRLRPLAESHARQHDEYAHADPPVPHKPIHIETKLIGFTIECICGYCGTTENPYGTGWTCPLDRTVQR